MDQHSGRGWSASDVPAQFRPLHKYLSGRFADTVVLTFTQIEDLLGVTLPGDARQRQDWWANPEPGTSASPQSSCWIQADRIASANLTAQTATFDRARA